MGLRHGSLLAILLVSGLIASLLANAPQTLAATTTVVSDPMSRVVAVGLGSAPSGGAYVLNDPEAFAVDGTRASVRIARGTDKIGRLPASSRDVESTVTLTLASIPATGSGVYFAHTTRRDTAGNEYRSRVRVTPKGATYLSFQRISSSGTATELGNEVAVPATAAGASFRFKASVTGTDAVILSAKVWPVTGTEPGWQAAATDSSSARQASAGQVGFWWYVSKSGTDTSATMDDYKVISSAATAPAPPPPRQGSVGAQLPIAYNIGGIAGAKYFVSTSGSDAAAGTERSPLRSVAAGIAKIPAGGAGSIIVRGGTYREGRLIIPGGKAVKIIAYPGEIPSFVGTEQFSSGWVSEGANRYHPYTPQPVTNGSGISFTTGQALTGDGVGKFPDQAWVGQRKLRQVTTKAAVTTGTFWVDSANKRIYLSGADVSQGSIEVSRLDTFLQVQGAGSSLEGVRVTRFSNSADDYGVVKLLGTADRTALRNVELTDSAFQGLMLAGDESLSGILADVVLQNVTVARSNWMGISSNMVDNLTMTRMKISNNNEFREFTDSPQSGAFKASRNRHVVLRDSSVSDNNGQGVWIDQSSYDVEIANSTFTDNSASSIFFEISDGLLLVNNYIRTTGGRAVKIAGASGVRLVNNTVVGAADPVGIYVDSRSKPGCADPSRPLCAGSLRSDRDHVRPRPATLDWMPRVDLMINNIVAYPTGSGYCGGLTTVCVTNANSTASAPINTVIHQADVTRGIPRTFIDGNVYANGTGRVVTTGGSSYSSHSAFGTAMAGSPVRISGIESRGLTGNVWVNPDGTRTSALSKKNAEAVPVPSDARINKYIPAGTRAYGHLD